MDDVVFDPILGEFRTAYELEKVIKEIEIRGGGGSSPSSSVSWGGIGGTLSAQTDLQTALDGKSNTNHTHLLATGATDVTASASEVNILDGATLTTTELNYVDGVTSAIQTQLDTKTDTANSPNANEFARFTDANTLEGRTVSETKTDLSLNNVDNTSDANKPVSTATQTALDLKLNTSAYDDATAAETNTGTSTAKYVSPDGLAGSYAGQKPIGIQVIDGATALTTGDGRAYFRIPTTLNGMDLIEVACSVIAKSTSGNPTVQIARGRQANATTAHAFSDMLSTALTIDANDFDSKDAGTPAVIDSGVNDVATGDLIRVDVDVAGTGTTGLNVNLVFGLP